MAVEVCRVEEGVFVEDGGYAGPRYCYCLRIDFWGFGD